MKAAGGAPLPVGPAYRLWASNYASTGTNPLTAAVDRAVARVLPDVAGATVLDVGCGLGRWALRLGAMGAAVTGVDLVEEMLRAAPAPFPSAVADAVHLPFAPAAFTGVSCTLMLAHVEHPAATLTEMASVLRPGGWLMLADIHPSARERGWRRTFRDKRGSTREVVWWAHPLSLVVGALEEAGLLSGPFVTETLEAAAGAPGAAEAAGAPAAFAVLARKEA